MNVDRVVLTCLLTWAPDPQRLTRWEPNPKVVQSLVESCRAHGWPVVIFHDERLAPTPIPQPGVQWVQTEKQGGNPYFYRWHLYADWLGWHNQIDQVWCVDGSDVEMLRSPQPVEGLCVGSEQEKVGMWWMRDHHPDSLVWIDEHADELLLNAGILGGPRRLVQEIADEIANVGLHAPRDTTDMAVFNAVVYRHGVFLTGEPVHTVYRRFDTKNEVCSWRHK